MIRRAVSVYPKNETTDLHGGVEDDRAAGEPGDYGERPSRRFGVGAVVSIRSFVAPRPTWWRLSATRPTVALRLDE
jgi:hypothetical protein